MQNHHFYLTEVIDPEFDEDDDELSLIEHVRQGKFFSVHPDLTLPDKGMKHWSHNHHRSFYWQNQYRDPHQNYQPQVQEPEPEPEPITPLRGSAHPSYAAYSGDYYYMLRSMDLDSPLAVGIARVWGDCVMINADGYDEFRDDPEREKWPLIWCGHGRMIFRKPSH